LIVVALYLLNNAFGFLSKLVTPSPRFLAIAGGAALAGLVLGAIHKSFEGDMRDKAQKAVGVALSSVSGALLVVGLTMPSAALVWEHIPAAEAKSKALGSGRPLIVDFGAAWCGACKELDKVTFSREDVRREAGRFLAVKVDATNDEDPKVEAAMSDFKVVGLPTVVIFDSHGSEAMRYTDFVEPDQLLAALKKVD